MLVKKKETPFAELRAFLKDPSLGKENEVFPGVLLKNNELGWEFIPCGQERFVCLPPGDRDDAFYTPWIGYKEGNDVRLYNVVNSGFRERNLPVQVTEEEDIVIEHMEIDNGLEDVWSRDMTNTFSTGF